MASTGVDLAGGQPHPHPVAGQPRVKEEKDAEKLAEAVPVETVSIDEGDHTHRRLKSRHIQLIGKFKVTAF